MKRLHADARLDAADANLIQNFRWTVGRFRLGQTRRFLREVAFDEGVRIDIGEECGWPWCTLYVTLRGDNGTIDRVMKRVEAAEVG